jgi:hypothetical protein
VCVLNIYSYCMLACHACNYVFTHILCVCVSIILYHCFLPTWPIRILYSTQMCLYCFGNALTFGSRNALTSTDNVCCHFLSIYNVYCIPTYAVLRSLCAHTLYFHCILHWSIYICGSYEKHVCLRKSDS